MISMEAGRDEIAGRNTPVLPVGSEEPVAKREEDDGGENATIVVNSGAAYADCGEVVLPSGGCRSSGEAKLVASGPLLTTSSF